MADTTHGAVAPARTQPTHTDPRAQRELLRADLAAADISVASDHENGWLRVYGSRAQLLAEGWVPPSVSWPSGKHRAEWKTERNHMTLRRCGKSMAREWGRPSDDCWMVCIDPVAGRPTWGDVHARLVMRKALELRELMCPSPLADGERALRERWWQARGDMWFQNSLKALTGVVYLPRGRQKKVSEEV